MGTGSLGGAMLATALASVQTRSDYPPLSTSVTSTLNCRSSLRVEVEVGLTALRHSLPARTSGARGYRRQQAHLTRHAIATRMYGAFVNVWFEVESPFTICYYSDVMAGRATKRKEVKLGWVTTQARAPSSPQSRFWPVIACVP